MIDALLQWMGGGGRFGFILSSGGLVAARIAPITVLAPWIALRAAPAIIRSAIILGLTIAFWPIAIESMPPLNTSFHLWLLLAARELLIGTIFALVSALPFFAVDWTGRVIDLWRGASLAQVFAPPTSEQTSPLGEFYLFFAVAMFAGLGGHRYIFSAFAESLEMVPIGMVAFEGGFKETIENVSRLTTGALNFAVALAAPAAVAVILVEMSLGLVARATPQVPVFFAGMPLRAATGLVAALLTIVAISDQLRVAFEDANQNVRALIRLMAG